MGSVLVVDAVNVVRIYDELAAANRGKPVDEAVFLRRLSERGVDLEGVRTAELNGLDAQKAKLKESLGNLEFLWAQKMLKEADYVADKARHARLLLEADGKADRLKALGVLELVGYFRGAYAGEMMVSDVEAASVMVERPNAVVVSGGGGGYEGELKIGGLIVVLTVCAVLMVLSGVVFLRIAAFVVTFVAVLFGVTFCLHLSTRIAGFEDASMLKAFACLFLNGFLSGIVGLLIPPLVILHPLILYGCLTLIYGENPVKMIIAVVVNYVLAAFLLISLIALIVLMAQPSALWKVGS